MALNFLKSLIPKVKAQDAEEELVDPQTELREKFAKDHHAAALHAKFQECQDRVNSRTKTAETCTEELMDFLHHVDEEVAKHLFQRLK